MNRFQFMLQFDENNYAQIQLHKLSQICNLQKNVYTTYDTHIRYDAFT